MTFDFIVDFDGPLKANRKYIIAYIDGYSLKYKTFETTAINEETAINNLYAAMGDFDHCIISVKGV